MISLGGLGHDGGGCVAALDVTRCRAHDSGCCARLQPECDCQTGQKRRGGGDDNLVNLFFAHNGLGFF